MDLNERDIYTDSIARSFQRESELMKAKQSRICQCIESGKVQTIVRRLSHETRVSNCKCGFDNCVCGQLSKSGSNTSKQSGDLSPEDLESLEKANQLRSDLSNDEVSLLRRQNAELCRELQHYKAKLAEMEKCMSEIEQQRNSNNNLEQEVAQLGSVKTKEMSNLRSSIDQKDDELSKIKKQLSEAKKKVQGLEKKLDNLNKELEELRPLRHRCCQLKKKLECAEKDAIVLNDKLMKDCEKYQKEAAETMKQSSKLKTELSEQLKASEGRAEQLRNRRNDPEEPKQEKSEDDSAKCAFLLKCIQDLKQHYCDMKADNIDKINCYENKIRILKAEIESLRCSSKRVILNKTSQCAWNANDCEDLLLRKIAKLGIESLQTDDLIDLHNRVKCAMMEAKRISKVDKSRTSPDYYIKLANELLIKYDLKNSLPAYTDLDQIPMKDFDMSSCKTMPALRSPRNKSANVTTKKERARSSDTSRFKNCDKPTRRVTIGRAIMK